VVAPKYCAQNVAVISFVIMAPHVVGLPEITVGQPALTPESATKELVVVGALKVHLASRIKTAGQRIPAACALEVRATANDGVDAIMVGGPKRRTGPPNH
jgi:hypothetical protein